MTQQPSNIIPAPIRVLPTHIIIRQFSGSDADHTARQFLDLYEAAIVSSSIAEDHDKIAFIRSRLLTGSRELIMMQSSAFNHPDIGTNYNAFKKNFIRFFGAVSKISIVRQIAHTVEALQKKCIQKVQLGWHG